MEAISKEMKILILDEEIARYDRTIYLLTTRAKVYTSIFPKGDERLKSVITELEEVYRIRNEFDKEYKVLTEV